MLKTAIIAAGALVAATLAPLPANASSASVGLSIITPQMSIVFGNPGRGSHWRGAPQRRMMSPQMVTRSLHRQGFRHISRLQRRGHVYNAMARHPRGYRVLIQVNAYTGQPVAVRRAAWR